ncbi:hypothetical protein AMECASPLE_035266 [Ameca splendens]|uniref:Uncharacterized protein n=1 Tax=Ameca splendens TaxID=208324 RepID=A0ABV1AEW9_9TELE
MASFSGKYNLPAGKRMYYYSRLFFKSCSGRLENEGEGGNEGQDRTTSLNQSLVSNINRFILGFTVKLNLLSHCFNYSAVILKSLLCKSKNEITEGDFVIIKSCQLLEVCVDVLPF